MLAVMERRAAVNDKYALGHIEFEMLVRLPGRDARWSVRYMAMVFKRVISE